MNFAILLAAGKGTRAQAASNNKLFTMTSGKPLLWQSLRIIHEHEDIDATILVIQESDQKQIESWLKEWEMPNILIAFGGETRSESVQNGFRAIPQSLRQNPDNDFILVHNAANPFLTSNEITETLKAAQKTGAACVAHPATDTLKKATATSSSEQSQILETLDRSQIWHTQTPQILRADVYEEALLANLTGTDEMTLAEQLNVSPSIIPASPNNFKITTSRDLEFARFLIEKTPQPATTAQTSAPAPQQMPPDVRNGIGMDSHRFDREHKGLTLGGLCFPEYPKMEANSDGDVMLHALCNAILQAIGEGSLGTIAETMFEAGITDSQEYLKRVLILMSDKNCALKQVGFQIEGSTPQIDPIADSIKENLSKILEIPADNIGITATTGEGLTPFGRGEGLQCFATVTLQ